MVNLNFHIVVYLRGKQWRWTYCSSYIPEIRKFRGYYVFGCAAAVSAVSAVSAAAARQCLYRPQLCHKYTNQIHIPHRHWGSRLQEPYDFWDQSEKTKWPLAAILYKNAQRACGVSKCVINSPINFIFGIAMIDNT